MANTDYTVIITESELKTSSIYNLTAFSSAGIKAHLYWLAAQYENFGFNVNESIQQGLRLEVSKEGKSLVYQAYETSEVREALRLKGN